MNKPNNPVMLTSRFVHTDYDVAMLEEVLFDFEADGKNQLVARKFLILKNLFLNFNF